jgi:hypothetical protein
MSELVCRPHYHVTRLYLLAVVIVASPAAAAASLFVAERFRIEVLFSPGAGYNPIEYTPPRRNHTLPAKPRVSLHTGDGISWKAFRSQLMPYASSKRQPCPAAYELTVGLKAPSPQVAKLAAGALAEARAEG